MFTWRIPSCLFLHNYPVHLQVFVKHVGSSFVELPCDNQRWQDQVLIVFEDVHLYKNIYIYFLKVLFGK